MLGQAQNMNSFAGVDVTVRIGHDVELAAPRAHFLEVRLELLEQRIVGRDRDDGHRRVDQRERTVLELARGVRLAMDVRNLLELERALEGNRIVQAAPQEKRILLL